MAKTPAVAATKTELVAAYQRATGLSPAPTSGVRWLRGEVSAAQARNSSARRTAAVAAGALVITGVGAYKRARSEGASKVGAGFQSALALAPGAALVTVQGVTNVVSHFPLPLGLSGGLPGAAAATRVLGKAILPTMAAWSAHRGAIEDTNPLRGAGRGLVRAVDPTAIITGKGVGEKLYDRAFGATPKEPDPGFFSQPKPKQKNSYEQFIDRSVDKLNEVLPFAPKKGRLPFITGSLQSEEGGPVAPPRTLHAAPHVTMFDKRYAKGPKAGTIERVRNTRWA